MLENVGNAITRLPIDLLGLWTKLGWSHPIIVPDMCVMMQLPWQRPLPSNGSLNIMQLWASGGQTRDPILLKFGKQQQIRILMTVT